MSSNEMMDRIKAYWDETSDSEWYNSLRTDEKIRHLKEQPGSAFHPAVIELIRKYLPDMEGKRILLPSSGDNHAAFAFAMMLSSFYCLPFSSFICIYAQAEKS